MRNINILTILISFTLLFTACESVLMKPNPATDNLSIFNEYATLVKEKYAMLEFKAVDIDQLSDSIRATITNDLTEAELFNKLAIITLRLKDGHSSLQEVPNGSLTPTSLAASYDFISDYPVGFDIDILINGYLGAEINPDVKILEGDQVRAVWGRLIQDEDIAYMWIPSWDVEITDDEIDSIFSDAGDAKGLIIDQRQNGGGDPSLATKFASYLTDTPVYTGFERFKTGPGLNAFTDSPITLQPSSSPNKFTKPTVVLHDRFVYSASTTFAYSTNPMDHVTFIGQRSGGGSGSVADGYLANGWYWSLSTSEFIDHEGRHLDNGILPDIEVALDITDASKDEVLERAILELR